MGYFTLKFTEICKLGDCMTCCIILLCKNKFPHTGSAVVRRIGDFGSPMNDARPENNMIRYYNVSTREIYFLANVGHSTAELGYGGRLCRDIQA